MNSIRTDTSAHENRHIAREISYSHSAQTYGGRVMIRAMEDLTGRARLLKRASGYDVEVANGNNFWQVMVNRYGLSLEVVHGSLENIPSEGPLILVANHPYGILDGLMMGHILSKTRNDFRIVAHKVFRKAKDLNNYVLPISFDHNQDALSLNLKTRKIALEYLVGGGAIGIFPGGTVSTALKPFDHPMDPYWRKFTARMITKSNAVVLPVFFEGRSSRLFQIASHLHYTLRMGLMIKEFKDRVDGPVRVVIGQPITNDELQERKHDADCLMKFLRQRTFRLSTCPVNPNALGFEFE